MPYMKCIIREVSNIAVSIYISKRSNYKLTDDELFLDSANESSGYCIVTLSCHGRYKIKRCSYTQGNFDFY